MSRSVRLEPAAIAPGSVEQLMVRLEEPSVVTGVKLDDPEAFEVLTIIAGPTRAHAPFQGELKLTIQPPNAFVIVLVKSKASDGETRICSGELLLSGDAPVAAPPSPHVMPQHVNPMVVHRAAPGPALPVAEGPTGKKTFDVDSRGWPLGGMNEVWVLLNRGEAERMVQAINGYPISAAERPALLRRFGQALGTVR